MPNQPIEPDMPLQRTPDATESAASTIHQLNSFLRGELSAVESYAKALEKVRHANAVPVLRDAMQSHQRRVELLRQQVRRVGGEPSVSSSLWGALVNIVESGSAMLGDRAAIAVLEEGEDHGLREYRTSMDKLDADSRILLEQELLPAQIQTHRLLSNLKRSFH